MGFIYKIYNDINDKIYIGQTSLTIQHRFNEHCKKSRLEEMKTIPLYNAMRKYGESHFFVEEVEETDDLFNREKYWIKFYNSYENGYNATLGGEGNPKLNYDLIVELYSKCQNASEVARQLNSDRHAICRVLKARGIEVLDPAEISRKKNSKMIGQYNKDTLELIAVYPSAAEAGRQIGKTAPHIIKCANGNRKTAYGYIWKYLENEEEKE